VFDGSHPTTTDVISLQCRREKDKKNYPHLFTVFCSYTIAPMTLTGWLLPNVTVLFVLMFFSINTNSGEVHAVLWFLSPSCPMLDFIFIIIVYLLSKHKEQLEWFNCLQPLQ